MNDIASNATCNIVYDDLTAQSIQDDQSIVFNHYSAVKTIIEAFTGIFIQECEKKIFPLSPRDVLRAVEETRWGNAFTNSSGVSFPSLRREDENKTSNGLLAFLCDENKSVRADAFSSIRDMCLEKLSSLLLAKTLYDAFVQEAERAVSRYVKKEKPSEYIALYLVYLVEEEKKQVRAICAWIDRFRRLLLDAEDLFAFSCPLNAEKKEEEAHSPSCRRRDGGGTFSSRFSSSFFRQSREEWERKKEAARGVSLLDLYERETGKTARKSGERFVGVCPFHEEQTPSFFIFPDNHYHCFGCGAHGDAILFYMTIRRVSFKEAVCEMIDAYKPYQI